MTKLPKDQAPVRPVFNLYPPDVDRLNALAAHFEEPKAVVIRRLIRQECERLALVLK